MHGMGNIGCGDARALCGEIRNLSSRQDGYDGAHLKFAYDGASPDEHALAFTVDGAILDILQASEGDAAAAGLADGNHSALIRPLRRFQRLPDLHGADFGARAFVTWARSADASCASYRVYQDGTAVATVTQIEVERRRFATPDSGTGRGRISSAGAYSGAINAGILIEIVSTGTARHTSPAGVTTFAFGAGNIVSMPYGITVTFHDAPEDYLPGDSWTVWIGPRNWYLSPELVSGTYEFAATAISVAGTESDLSESETKTIKIVAPPDDLIGVQLSYADDALTVSWTLPDTVDGVRVYSNFDLQLGRFVDYVIEQFPHADTSGESWQFTTTATGTLFFYLRTYSGAFERDSIALYSFQFPPTPANLGVILGSPVRVNAAPAAAGHILTSWDYAARTDDALASFKVCIGPDPDAFNWSSPTATVLRSAGASVPLGSQLLVFGHTSAAAYVGTQYVSLRPVASTGDMGAATTPVAVTPSADAPTFTGEAMAVPQ